MKIFLLTAASFVFLAGAVQAADVPKTQETQEPQTGLGQENTSQGNQEIVQMACFLPGSKNKKSTYKVIVSTPSNPIEGIAVCFDEHAYQDMPCSVQSAETITAYCQKYYDANAVATVPADINCSSIIPDYNPHWLVEPYNLCVQTQHRH
jgi:opacity protein-like surface antigen